MKQRPILFQTAMVRAILAGTKTQTRRVVTPAPTVDIAYLGGWVIATKKSTTSVESINNGSYPDVCPYGEVGDVLWVRETFYGGYVYDDVKGLTDQFEYWYRADTLDARPGDLSDEWCINEFGADNKNMWPKWKPSIHMPYAAARLFLKITSIRMERLQDISEGDAWAEGCKKGEPTDNGGFFPAEESDPSGIGERGWDCAKDWYADLWESINGIDSWAENPWVWVVEFERVGPVAP